MRINSKDEVSEIVEKIVTIRVDMTKEQYEEYTNWCFLMGITKDFGAKIIWRKGLLVKDCEDEKKLKKIGMFKVQNTMS